MNLSELADRLGLPIDEITLWPSRASRTTRTCANCGTPVHYEVDRVPDRPHCAECGEVPQTDDDELRKLFVDFAGSHPPIQADEEPTLPRIPFDEPTLVNQYPTCDTDPPGPEWDEDRPSYVEATDRR